MVAGWPRLIPLDPGTDPPVFFPPAQYRPRSRRVSSARCCSRHSSSRTRRTMRCGSCSAHSSPTASSASPPSSTGLTSHTVPLSSRLLVPSIVRADTHRIALSKRVLRLLYGPGEGADSVTLSGSLSPAVLPLQDVRSLLTHLHRSLGVLSVGVCFLRMVPHSVRGVPGGDHRDTRRVPRGDAGRRAAHSALSRRRSDRREVRSRRTPSANFRTLFAHAHTTRTIACCFPGAHCRQRSARSVLPSPIDRLHTDS